MGRLIDENILVKYIDKHTHDQNTLDDDITCILEEVPTAFDVDAVIGEIEYEIKWAETHGTDKSFRNGRVSGLLTAIRIVRGSIK